MSWDLPKGVTVEAVYMMNRDPSFEKDGVLYLPDDFAEWYELPNGWQTRPSQCAHDESACRKCLAAWREDHVVVLLIDGQEINLDEMDEDGRGGR